MMDLQAELLSLRRLYRLLVKDEHCLDDTGFENLDDNARRLLLNLLNVAADKAFEAHAKIIGTQFRPSNSIWSAQQDQSRDKLKLQPFFSLENSPISFGGVGQSTKEVPNVNQPFDLLTGDGNFGESKNQEFSYGQSSSISPGEFNVKLKRCRVCLKPKINQLTKETSFRDGEFVTNRYQAQNRKRSWEDENESSGVGGLTYSSSSSSPVDFFNPLHLTNLSDKEDQISREASAKILRIESCISSLQEAAKRVDFFDNYSESGPSQTEIFGLGRHDPDSGTTSQRPCKPGDKALQWHDNSAGSINELTWQSQPSDMRPVNMKFPSSQTPRQPSEYVGQGNQHDHMTMESYNLFHGTGFTSNMNKAANEYHPSRKNESSQIRNEPLDEMRTTQLWSPPVESTVQTKHHSEVQESKNTRWGPPVEFTVQARHHSEVQESKNTRWGPPVDTTVQARHHSEVKESENTRWSPPVESTVQERHHSEVQESENTRWGLPVESTVHARHHSEVQESENTRWGPPFESTVQARHHSEGQESENTGWGPLVEAEVQARHRGEVQESENTRREYHGKTYKDKEELDHHKEIRRKHEVVDPKRLVSSKSPSLSDSPVSSSNYSSSLKSQSQSQSQTESQSQSESQSQQDSTSPSNSESVYSGSSISTDNAETDSDSESESETYSDYSEDQSAYTNSSDKSSGSISVNTLPKKGVKMGNKKVLKTKRESDRNSVSSQGESSNVSSSNASSVTKSKKPVSTKGQKGSNKKEPQKKKEKENKSVRTQDHSSSGSVSKNIVPKKGHKMRDLKKLTNNQVGQFKKLKDKLSVIFHHHHHHHHHHHDGSGEKDKHKKVDTKSIWKQAKKAIGNTTKKAEALGEQAVKKVEKKALVLKKVDKNKKGDNKTKKSPLKDLVGMSKKALVLKVGDKKKKGDENKKSQLTNLVGGFLKHSSKPSKKSDKSKSIVPKTQSVASKKDGGGKPGVKMQWLQMLRQQRKIKRIDKLRGKVKTASKVGKTKKK